MGACDEIIKHHRCPIACLLALRNGGGGFARSTLDQIWLSMDSWLVVVVSACSGLSNIGKKENIGVWIVLSTILKQAPSSSQNWPPKPYDLPNQANTEEEAVEGYRPIVNTTTTSRNQAIVELPHKISLPGLECVCPFSRVYLGFAFEEHDEEWRRKSMFAKYCLCLWVQRTEWGRREKRKWTRREREMVGWCPIEE